MTSEITVIEGMIGTGASVAENRGFNSLSSHHQNQGECNQTVTVPLSDETIDALTRQPDSEDIRALCGRFGIVRLPVGKSERFALVDVADSPRARQHRWYPLIKRSGAVYAITTFGEKKPSTSLHRFILGLQRGNPLWGEHRNRIPLDNRRENLRFATRAQNNANRGRRKTSTNPYKGIGFRSDFVSKQWFATIKINNKPVYLGRFLSAIEAARAYDAKARELYGEFACLNFPERSAA